MTYNEDTIRGALNLLNTIEVKGFENMKRILLIEQILQNPEAEEKQDGGKDSL